MPPEDSSRIKSQGGGSQETTKEKQTLYYQAAQHIILSPAAGRVGYPCAASARGPGTELVSV